MTTDRVLVARAKYDGGEFKRKVTGRVPTGLFHDELVLEPGHSHLGFRQITFEAPGEPVQCRECAEAWMAAPEEGQP